MFAAAEVLRHPLRLLPCSCVTMDLGCNAVHMLRTFGDWNPEVVSAQAKLRGLRSRSGDDGPVAVRQWAHRPVRCSMWSSDLLQLSAKVVGDRGQLRVLSPVAPFRRLSVRSADGNRVERFPGAPPTRISLTLSPRRCARRTGKDDAARRDREHDRRRCDLSRCRPPAHKPA